MSIELRDVSSFQGAVDWAALARSGLAGGLAKASEGVGYEDSRWRANQAALLGLGSLVGGSYHFARPDLNPGISGAVAEAGWYLSRHDPRCFEPGVPWIFALDAESAGGSAAWCYAFLAHVAERTGYACWFYSYASWIDSRGVRAIGSPLWLAWPDTNGPLPTMGWPVVSMQQYGVGGAPGIAGQVDLNRFLGDLAGLLTLAGVIPPVPVPPSPAALGDSHMRIAIRPGGPNDRYDRCALRANPATGAMEYWHGWGDSLGGLRNGANADGSRVGEENIGSPPGVSLVAGTEWITWNKDGAVCAGGAMDEGGREWHVVGSMTSFVGPGGGWAALPGVVDALPSGAPGPAGPPGPSYDDGAIRGRLAVVESDLAHIKMDIA